MPAAANATGIASEQRPKAFSYVRFSTPDQAKGASYDRQIEAAQAYAQQRGLELAETTYKDLGVSAFRRTNAQTGALRQATESAALASLIRAETVDQQRSHWNIHAASAPHGHERQTPAPAA